MKTILAISACLLSLAAPVRAQQTLINAGGGYFGQTVTHPGLVLELEAERAFSEKATLPIRLDLGFYAHPRNHYGLFLDVNAGFRRYFNSGLFLEESIGVGVLETFLNSDGTFSVEDDGTVTEVSPANPPDLMPSLTVGLGYNLTQGSGKRNLIWIRPKIYWQFPHKTSSNYMMALQVGFTHTIRVQ